VGTQPTDTGAGRRSKAPTGLDRVFSPILPPSYEQNRGHAERVELASDRRIRDRNKIGYRLAHWPIWIWVFFIAPGPLTFDLFERGFDARMALWLGAVVVGTGLAGLLGQLPGVEPRPYIIRFTEDKPNPLYRRVCYTFAWSAVITFAVLNITGLAWAIATGEWRMRQIYDAAYLPIAATIWLLGLVGRLPRVLPSTKNEGHERRFFYGSVWAVCIGQPVLWLLWRVLPQTRISDTIKLLVFLGILTFFTLRFMSGSFACTYAFGSLRRRAASAATSVPHLTASPMTSALGAIQASS